MMKVRLALLGLLLVSGTVPAAPPAATLDQRVERIERILRNQSMSEMLLRIQRLEREVQQLRGELESQAHTMSKMQQQQRDLYLDIDNRLGQMKSTDGGVAPPVPVVTDAPPAEAAAPSSPAPGAEPRPQAAVADPAGEEDAYQKSSDLLMQGRYAEAIASYQEFLDRYPAGQYASNAQYWLGEANYVDGKFDAALTEFEKVLNQYPDSRKVPDAMLKIGKVHMAKKQWKEARAMLERLNNEYSSTSAARLAAKELDDLKKQGH